MDKMILKNGFEVDLQAGAALNAIKVAAADRAAMLTIWEQLAPENLKEVTFKTGEGLTVGTYTDLVLVYETSEVAADGTVVTSYNFREKTVEEKRLDALEEGQAVQDGAIEDLGAVTSALAEGGTE